MGGSTAKNERDVILVLFPDLFLAALQRAGAVEYTEMCSTTIIQRLEVVLKPLCHRGVSAFPFQDRSRGSLSANLRRVRVCASVCACV